MLVGWIKKILSTKTFRDSGVTLFGTAINGLIGVIFYILIARHLGPANYGIFAVSITTLTLTADIFSLGVGTGIIRFVGKYITTDADKAFKIMKLSFLVNFGTWLLVLGVGWFLMPLLAIYGFQKPELVWPLKLATIGVGGALLNSFVTNAFQALQRYWKWMSVNVFGNLLRLLLLLGLVYCGWLNASTGIVAYLLPLFAGFLIGLIFLPNFWRVSVRGETKLTHELFSFNKWVSLFIVITAISSRLDTFLASKFLSLYEVGIYSVAVSLTGIVPQVVYALGAVVAPKLAGFNDRATVVKYLKKLQLFVLGLSIAGILVGIILSKVAIPYFYGEAYLTSFGPFVILLVSQAIFLLAVPVHTTVMYYFARSDVFVWISLVHLSVVLLLGYLGVINYGYMGLAVTMLMGNVLNLLIPAFWVVKKFRKL